MRARVLPVPSCHLNHRQRADEHAAWLEDMAIRLVCVLALDRFGDYMREQVRAQQGLLLPSHTLPPLIPLVSTANALPFPRSTPLPVASPNR